MSLHLKHRFDKADDFQGFENSSLLLELILFNRRNVDNAVNETQKQVQLADDHLDNCNGL